MTHIGDELRANPHIWDFQGNFVPGQDIDGKVVNDEKWHKRPRREMCQSLSPDECDLCVHAVRVPFTHVGNQHTHVRLESESFEIITDRWVSWPVFATWIEGFENCVNWLRLNGYVVLASQRVRFTQ